MRGEKGAGQEERLQRGSTEAMLAPGLGCQGTEGKEGSPMARGWGWSPSTTWEVPKPGSPTHALWGHFAQGALSCITSHIPGEK